MLLQRYLTSDRGKELPQNARLSVTVGVVYRIGVRREVFDDIEAPAAS